MIGKGGEWGGREVEGEGGCPVVSLTLQKSKEVLIGQQEHERFRK